MLAFTPIGIIHSCFREKFGIPRQPGLVPAARATLELLPPYNQPATVRGLEGFSHVWLVFVFHGIPAGHWQPTVRPPRLGGNRRLGLFATRTPFRPNPIGLSVVRLERVAINRGQVTLHLTGIDLLDETPVLDIKPYLPYVDCIPTATGGFATELPVPGITVEFSPEAATVCAAWSSVNLRELITQLLAQDPRPAYERADPDSRCYGMKLFDFDVRWEMRDGLVYVMEIVPIEKAGSVPTPADESPHPADRPGWPPSAGQ